MMDELREPIDPALWAPWKRFKGRKAAEALLATLRERGLDAESLAEVERIFEECGMLGTDA
jgi:hypothetical protein